MPRAQSLPRCCTRAPPAPASTWTRPRSTPRRPCWPTRRLNSSSPARRRGGGGGGRARRSSPEPVRSVASPLRLSETPVAYASPPPRLGEHTDQVLGARLGLSAGEIAALRAKGVV